MCVVMLEINTFQQDLSPIRKDRTPDKIQGFISGLDLIDRGK